MRRLVFFFFVLFAPLQVSALDFGNYSTLYTDAPFSPGEAAGISLLTNLDAVSGYPDGSFQPNRTLNRAEFLKIVLLSSPGIRVSPSDASNCFPDVRSEDWFSRYVCLAKKRGIVGGYPDGNFKPQNTVNYAEALKILGEIYNYTAWSEPDAPWYAMYAQAAKNHKTELPISIRYDHFLSRGQMARLAAAFRADHEQELALYRQAEWRGYYVVKKEKKKECEDCEGTAGQSADGSQQMVDESESGSGEVVEVQEAPVLPSVSHLLEVGTLTPPLADARFTVWDDDAYLRIFRVRFSKKLKSIKRLYLMNKEGERIGELTPDRYDENDERWRIDFPSVSSGYILSEGKLTSLYIEAELKDETEGGISGEMIVVEHMDAVAQGVQDSKSRNLVATAPHYPIHQTVLGLLHSIENAGDTSGVLQSGRGKLLALFRFEGETRSIGNMAINSITLTPKLSYGVAVDNWQVGTTDTPLKQWCSVSPDESVQCSGLQTELGELGEGSRILHLYGDVEVGGVETGKSLQLILQNPGELGVNGAVYWSDGSGNFRWLEKEAPLAEGTYWTIEN